MALENVSVQIGTYKCFGPDPHGYERIMPINLIIGRNNAGKSAMLDLIDYLTQPKDLSALSHRGVAPRILVSDTVSEAVLRTVFPAGLGGGPIHGDHWVFGSQWIGKRMTVEVRPNVIEFVSIEPAFGFMGAQDYEKRLAERKGNPFSGFVFRRLQAERDIVPEPDTDSLDIAANGRGLTNAFQNFINKASLPSDLIEKLLLGELNRIFEPDATFTDITVQKLNTGNWELYIEEAEKGRVSLTHSGSGIKTILLLLAFLHLVPVIQNVSPSQYLFGFEELENYLHPAIQRRLLLYLREKAVEVGFRVFLTTHSSVAIDLFASDDRAQILHVTHDGRCASVKRTITYVDNRGILDDLDIRASDLLQANGIVWLEGPSDRLYFNRWIDLWSDGKIKEGAHYQCVYYGGRLLAHLSANDPQIDPDETVKILKVNRNAILLIDSDQKKEGEPINQTKKRLLSEIEGVGGIGWVTVGKEIENYIPKAAIGALYGSATAPDCGRYEHFADYLDRFRKGEGLKYSRNKVLFAERVTPRITKENMATLDLNQRLEEVCKRIKAWNGDKA